MSENKFKHLTEEQLEAIYQQYRQGEKVTTLLELYAIDLSPSMFIRSFPPKACDDLACPYCNVMMFQPRAPRQASWCRWDPAFCKHCDHLHHWPHRARDTPHCHCPPCLADRERARRKQEAERRESILAVCVQNSHPPLPLATLGIRTRLHLMALLETCMDRRQNNLRVHVDACITPTAQYDGELLHGLHEACVLLVDPNSPLSAFGDGPTPTPQLDKVHWLVNVHLGDGQRAGAAQVHRALHDELSRGPVPAWREEIAETIHTLAIEEVYGFLEACCDEHDMPLHPWKKSREVITDLLQFRPVCQLWSLANSAVNNAVTYASKSGISKRQASNGIPKSMAFFHDKALEDQWRFARWNGNSTKCPRSGLAKVLHGLLLKHDDHGRERRLADYLAALPALEGRCGDVSHFSCMACGSMEVHVQARAQERVINCKDCMARSVLSGLDG